MKMKLVKAVPVLIVGFAGCVNPPPPSPVEDIVTDFNKISSGESIYFSLSVSDDNFAFTVDRNGVPSFKVKNPEMTLDDLTDFVRVRCLNERLYPKLMKGEPLSKEESLLLVFAMDAQALMIKSIGCAMAWDILGKDGEFKFSVPQNQDIPELAKREDEVFIPLMERFMNCNSDFRNQIRNYCRHFEFVREDVKGQILDDVFRTGSVFEDGTLGSESRGVVNSHPWLFVNSPVIAGVVWEAETHTMGDSYKGNTLSDYEKSAVNVMTDGDIGMEWRGLWDVSRKYLEEYWLTYKRVEAYSVSDNLKGEEGLKSRKFAKLIHQRSITATNLLLGEYCTRFYDYPFVLLTMKAREKYKGSKGWDDDEKKIFEGMVKYGETISGTDMLSHLNSTYAIDVYADFLEKVKSDIEGSYFLPWRNDYYKRLMATSRIREFAREKNRKDLDTGLETNGFKNME